MIQHFPFHLFTVIYGEITQGLCRILEHKVGWAGRVSPSVNGLLFRRELEAEAKPSKELRDISPLLKKNFSPPEGLNYSGICHESVFEKQASAISLPDTDAEERAQCHRHAEAQRLLRNDNVRDAAKSPHSGGEVCYQELGFFPASATWLE